MQVLKVMGRIVMQKEGGSSQLHKYDNKVDLRADLSAQHIINGVIDNN